MREIKSDYDKKLSRNINKIKKGVKELEAMGLKIYADKNIETMIGSLVDNIYIRDYIGKKVILQKHLFTIRELKERK